MSRGRRTCPHCGERWVRFGCTRSACAKARPDDTSFWAPAARRLRQEARLGKREARAARKRQAVAGETLEQFLARGGQVQRFDEHGRTRREARASEKPLTALHAFDLDPRFSS